MTIATRIETTLEQALRLAENGCPPRLLEAIRHAVIPGGGRIRPGLCLRVARACGDDAPVLADATAAAIELLHCASLVHDDLPCFDDADSRRGRPSVQREFGEQLAVLTGDALIVLAFETLAAGAADYAARLPPLMTALTAGVGPRRGIIAGQAWESEPEIDLPLYHRTKTAALFEAAIVSGAIASGGDPESWRPLGSHLGQAYQVADDLHDVASDGPATKPTGRDASLGRPNAAIELGIDGALSHLNYLRTMAIASVPAWAESAELVAWLNTAIYRLVPAWLREEPAARAMVS